MRNGAVGAALLTIAFLVGVRWGPTGLALAWLAGYPLYLLDSARRALPVIGARFGDVAAAIAPAALAALGMASVVTILDRALPPALPAQLRLAALVSAGAALYLGWLATFARPTLRLMTQAVWRRQAV